MTSREILRDFVASLPAGEFQRVREANAWGVALFADGSTTLIKYIASGLDNLCAEGLARALNEARSS